MKGRNNTAHVNVNTAAEEDDRCAKLPQWVVVSWHDAAALRV